MNVTDNLTPEQRKKSMRSIRSKNTSIELKLRKKIWSFGYRYYIHYKLPGKPDIVFPRKKIVIFVDGCFWHKCPKCYKKPKTNVEYWIPKLDRNVERAKEVNELLKQDKWIVLRYYECEIKKNFDGVIKDIIRNISKK